MLSQFGLTYPAPKNGPPDESPGFVASMPGVLQCAAAQEAATSNVGAGLADLGLPELNLTVTLDAVEGVPESLEAGRYLLTVSSDSNPSSAPADGPGSTGAMFLLLPDGMTLDDAMAHRPPSMSPCCRAAPRSGSPGPAFP